MATIHTIIQSKSVGKTFAAMTLAHYLRDERGQTVLCLDTDAVNASLSGFAALHAVNVNIHALADHCRTIPQETAHVVIDTSTTGFLPFCSGLRGVFLPALAEAGHTLHLHTIVTGGPPALETFNGFRTLAGNFPDIPMTVWLNPFYGEVALQGTPFEDSKVFQEHMRSVHALVRMHEGSELSQGDLQTMLTRHLTFKEAIDGGHFHIITQSRIHRIWRHMIDQLTGAAICG